jgi:hypothetical protein
MIDVDEKTIYVFGGKCPTGIYSDSGGANVRYSDDFANEKKDDDDASASQPPVAWRNSHRTNDIAACVLRVGEVECVAIMLIGWLSAEKKWSVYSDFCVGVVVIVKK